jgi:hypothetical protein
VRLLLSLFRRKEIWQRLAVERLTEPLHLNLIAPFVAIFGGLRSKIAFDLLLRPQHAYGLLNAADQARKRGIDSLTVVELGVGGGTGLLNLCSLAQRVTKETGVKFEIVGFDTGTGMPPPIDHRDHPELYREGFFPMDRARLERALPPNARLVIGDIGVTIDDFVASLGPSSPLGFATLDVDYYSSSTVALRLFTGQPDCYLPWLEIYVDDLHEASHSEFAGELLAIHEFNAAHELRKIERDTRLPYSRVFKHAEWLSHMFKLHVFDHPERRDVSTPDDVLVIDNPYLSR